MSFLAHSSTGICFELIMEMEKFIMEVLDCRVLTKDIIRWCMKSAVCIRFECRREDA